jgi:hypothetical protein
MKLLLILPNLTLCAVLLFSCGQKPSKNSISAETYNHYLETGSEISMLAQAALLTQVSRAMEQGGSKYAVEFCNLQASAITDSLNNFFNCTISRVSVKNRNSQNALETNTDKQLWAYYHAGFDEGLSHDTLIREEKQLIYYKPILTAMPACLQCHGPVNEMNPDTHQKIQSLYPGDRATGYSINELRGMWKIAFSED